MKIFYKFLIIANILFTASLFAQSKWTWLNPLPCGNNIYSTCFVDQQVGYSSCASSTILKTTNGGLNWNVINLPNSFDFRGICFPSSNTGYVCGSRGVIFKTTDAANNWQEQLINDSLNFFSIAFKDANTGFAGTDYFPYRIYETTNGGNAWIQIMADSIGSVNLLYFVNANTVIAGGGTFLKVSTDAGSTWKDVGLASDSATNVSASFFDANTGFVYNSGGRIFKTTDGAITWSQINLPASLAAFASICFFDQNTGIIAGNFTAIWKTTNGGSVWFKVSNFSDTSRSLYTIGKINASNAMISGEGGLIYRTTDAGNSFTEISKSFTDQKLLSASFIDQSTGIVSGVNGTIFKTVNSGQNWTQLNCPEAGNIFKVKYLTIDTVIAVSDNGRVYKSVNGGNTWSIIYRDAAASNWSAVGFYGTRYFIIQGGQCAHSGVVTRNAGLTWDTLYAYCNCGGPQTGCYLLNKMEMADTNHYCAFGQSCLPYTNCSYYVKSNYDTFYFGDYLFNAWMSCLDSSNAIVVGDEDGISHIWRTYDGYRTFVDYDNQSGIGFTAVSLLSKNVGISYGGRGDNYSGTIGIFMTTNGGQSWGLTGSPTDNIVDLAYVKNKLAMTWGYFGTLVIDNNPMIITSAETRNQLIPIKFNLFQNYPNPFNPVTQIKFVISKTSFVTITVYDVLGREVEKLVNETKLPGNYTVSFNGINFASGVYFYTLKAGDYKESKKMVLIK